ncbi:unnamed protein product, partial [Iphiclides podalirius]
MSIGKIAEFKVHTDNWRLYVERLEQYFAVNKIASELHVPTLITVMGAECYELLKRVLDSQQRQAIRRRSRLSDVTCPDVANDVERASNGPEDEFADACSDLQTEGVASATERNKEAEEAEGSDDTPGDTPVVSDTVSEAPTPPHLSPPVTRPKRIRRPVIRYN